MNHLEKTDTQLCFQLLQNIMLHAFNTDTLFLKAPYSNDTNIHPDIINSVWPNYNNTDEQLFPSPSDSERRFFVIKTNLAFYNLVIYINAEPFPDIFSVGPFRSNEISLESYSVELERSHLPSNMLTKLTNYYASLPMVSLNNIVDTVSYIITTYLPDGKKIKPIYKDYSKLESLCFDTTLEPKHSHEESVEISKNFLCKFLDYITKGDSLSAEMQLNEFLMKMNFLPIDNLSMCKRHLAMLNDYCQISLLNSHINLVQASKLYLSLINSIEHVSSSDAVRNLAKELCMKYCALSQSNLTPEYSKTVNAVINYIHSHLEEPLTLSCIAEHFRKNAAALSSSFTQNTGMTITNYIQHTRIKKATQYFNTTNLSVSEVAVAVGFQDFAYFSRLFRKYMGCSPKEYRDSHQKK